MESVDDADILNRVVKALFLIFAGLGAGMTIGSIYHTSKYVF